MRQTVAITAAVLVTVWLQAYFFGGVRPLGVLPNLLLVMLTFLALFGSTSQALTAALAGGLWLDLASGTDFGLRMAFYSLFVLGVVFAHQLGSSPDSFWTAAALVIAGTVAYNLAVLSSLVITRTEFSIVASLRITGLEVLVNLVLAVLTAQLWRWLFRPGPQGVPA